MKHMRRLTVILLVSIIFMGMIPPSAAKSIHAIRYEDLNGNTVSFDQYTGKNLVVEAFSSECTHCMDFHPRLAAMYDQYNDSLTLVSVSINPDDTAASIKSFEQDYPTTWEIGLEKDDLNSNFGIEGTPTTLMFNGNGDLKVCIVGAVSQTELLDHTQQFLNSSDYTYSVENGMCPAGSFIDRFMGSIYFPITMALIFYAGFFLIRRYFNKTRENTMKEELLK